MNAIRSVFIALGNLASAVNGLAAVLDMATGRLRQQLALDGETAPAVLEHNAGAVLDDAPSTNGNGKRKARAG